MVYTIPSKVTSDLLKAVPAGFPPSDGTLPNWTKIDPITAPELPKIGGNRPLFGPANTRVRLSRFVFIGNFVS